MIKIDPLFLSAQLEALEQYVEDELGEDATVCLYCDGSVMIETSVTPDRDGRGFGFNSIRSLIDKIGEFKRD